MPRFAPLAAAGCTFLLCTSTAALGAAGHGLKEVPVPAVLDVAPGLDARREAQLATRNEIGAFTGFSFSDQRAASGIDFKHRVVEDAGKTYKAVHYDHGNGVAVADVDGDGHYDIYFANQVGGNQLWRNLGNGRFENITAAAGVAVDDRISVTASFGDIDNDGDPDLYVTAVRRGNLLFENDGKGRFRDITQESGLGYQGHSSGAVLFDYNRDGLLDVYLVNVGQYTTELPVRTAYEGVEYLFYLGLKDAFSGHRFPERTETSKLFANRGDNRFEDVTATMYLADFGWSGDATIVDVNDDGWPDLYELNMQGHDQYYENLKGEGFILRSRAVFPKTSWGAMGIKSFDWNNDGRMDIFITDMHSDMSQKVGPEHEKLKSEMTWDEEHLMSGGNSVYGNTFFEQQADGTFAEISDRIGVENYWPWGLSAGDLNADGYQDLFIASSMNYPFRYGINSLLINDAGERFRDAEFILGVEPREGPLMTTWFELDCAGPDARLYDCRGHDERVMIMGALGSRSSVLFDLDEDGDLDIVTNDFNSHPQVLVSDLAEQRGDALHYLRLKLVGTASNRGAIGARVTVTAGGRNLTQVLDGKSGYLSQSLKPLYFGLGEAATVDRIEIRWPSGQVQTLDSGIETNTLLTLTEPAG